MYQIIDSYLESMKNHNSVINSNNKKTKPEFKKKGKENKKRYLTGDLFSLLANLPVKTSKSHIGASGFELQLWLPIPAAC